MNLGSMPRAGRLRPGDPTRIGTYSIVGRLGSGGMGVVYLAQDETGHYVAVKVVHEAYAQDPEFRARFRSEVERAREVPPFCTAEVLDADPEHNPPYLVVEFVDGPSLGDVVSDSGPLSSANVHAVAIGVASALTAIHGAGVVHRDLKPRNVLLAPGSPKVIDFGIARALETVSQHTAPGQMVGTLAYMAPERLDGYSDSATSAADVFAWGAVVTYAATGRTPFDGGGSPHVLAAQILTAEPNLTGVPGELREPVRRALARDPHDRPSARELLDLLISQGAQPPPEMERMLEQQTGVQAARSPGVTARPGGPGRRRAAPPAPAGNRGRLAQVAVVLIAIAGLLGGGAFLFNKANAETPPKNSVPRIAADKSGIAPPTQPIASALNRKCISVPGDRFAEGQHLAMQPCADGAINQAFAVLGDGALRLNNLCMDVAWGSKDDGAVVQIANCNGQPAQQFTVTEDNEIISPQSGKCVQITGASSKNGAELEIFTCAGKKHQRWEIG
jgi:hypothetical protein